MIDVDTEDLTDLNTACSHPALRNTRSGKPCHVAQLYRYVQRGARAANGDRIRLETIRTPSGLRTSREAIGRFIATLTDPDAPKLTMTSARKKRRASAENELTAAGFDIGGDTA